MRSKILAVLLAATVWTTVSACKSSKCTPIAGVSGGVNANCT